MDSLPGRSSREHGKMTFPKCLGVHVLFATTKTYYYLLNMLENYAFNIVNTK